MQAGRVSALYRYPVKSMGGEALDRVTFGERGIPGDRAWAVRDEVRGGIRGGKRFPALMNCAARYPEAPPDSGSATAIVTLPDGRELGVDDAAEPAALTELVGSAVTVWPLMPAEMLDHYRRGAPVLEDMEAELRRVFARTPEEPLPDLGTFPSELIEFESPPGTYFDAFPVLVMTTQGLAHLQRVAGEHNFDVRRFRPNVLIDAEGDAPYPERDWVGRELEIGSAVLKLEMDCPRCAMTTHGFADLPKDPGIMRTLVGQADGNLGVYASVVQPGTLSSGDIAQLR